MAVYKIFPTKDATLYSQYNEMNTGLDEIVEASTLTIGTDVVPQATRFLMQFSLDEIRDVLDNKVDGVPWSSYLRVFAANIEGLNLTSSIEAYACAQSWNMGTGKYLDSPQITNGVSWKYRESTTNWQTGPFNIVTTGSFPATNKGGGTWHTAYVASQSYAYQYSTDLELDVSGHVTAWNREIIKNWGFLLKQPKSHEFVYDSNYNQTFRFFSIDTHTIYPPQLEFRWDDSSWDTGSSDYTVIDTDDYYISFNNNLGVYNSESIQRFRLNVRPQFPARVFTTQSVYVKQYYLPEKNSLYAIKDLDTNEYVVNFDKGSTRISADEESSYFDVYMNGLEPERYYKLLIKSTVDGSTTVYDENLIFKVSNG